MAQEHSSDHELTADPAADVAAAEGIAEAITGGTPVSHAHQARNNRVIWLLLAASFIVILNETIMGVAIPHLVNDLGVDLRAAQWLTTAFMLTMAVVIPTTGFLLQRFNTRPIFIAAMSLFSVGTLLAAVSPGFLSLLLARIVQASGTAIMLPLLMTTLMTLVEPQHRGRIMGRVSIVISVAPAIGPTISGLILNYLSWRFMFLLVLPIAVVMLVIGIFGVKNVTETRPAPIDVVSIVLAALGFGGIVYGLSQIGSGAEDTGTMPMLLIGCLAVGVASIALFVFRQIRLQHQDRALLDLRTFHSRIFSISVALMAIVTMALFGSIIVLPIYLQDAIQLPPVYTGLLLLPGGLVMGLLGPVVGRLFDRFGPKPLIIPGSFLLTAVLCVFTQVTDTTPPALILAAHIGLSIGLALIFTPLFTTTLGSVKPALYSHGSAVVGTVQQVAGAAGTALFVTVLATQQAISLSAGVSPAAAVADGVRSAFLIGAIISVFAIAGSFFIRKPDA